MHVHLWHGRFCFRVHENMYAHGAYMSIFTIVLYQVLKNESYTSKYLQVSFAMQSCIQ